MRVHRGASDDADCGGDRATVLGAGSRRLPGGLRLFRSGDARDRSAPFEVERAGPQVSASLVLPVVNRGTVVTRDGRYERMALSSERAHAVRDPCVGVRARVVVHMAAGRFGHRAGAVLPASSEAGEGGGASFTFAATVGSRWRATPQTAQRLRFAEFSW